MTFLQTRSLLAAASTLLLSLHSTALGDGGALDGSARLPATFREVSAFLETGDDLRSIRELHVLSRAVPQRIALRVYRWRLADGWLETSTVQVENKELISCWGKPR